MKCCCVSNFIRRGKTSRRSSKGQKRSQKKDNKQDKSKNLKEIFRDFTRDNKLLRRDKFLRENKQFFTPFSKCSASIAVLKIHDKPLPYYWEKQTEKTFSSHGGHFAIDPPTKRSPFSDETKDDATHFVNAIYFFEFFVFFFARTEADGVLLSKMGIHPRGEERW